MGECLVWFLELQDILLSITPSLLWHKDTNDSLDDGLCTWSIQYHHEAHYGILDRTIFYHAHRIGHIPSSIKMHIDSIIIAWYHELGRAHFRIGSTWWGLILLVDIFMALCLGMPCITEPICPCCKLVQQVGLPHEKGESSWWWGELSC